MINDGVDVIICSLNLGIFGVFEAAKAKGDSILVTEKNEPLWNARVLPDGTYEMFAKADSQRYVFRPVKGSACTQDPARQDSGSCHQCHSVKR